MTIVQGQLTVKRLFSEIEGVEEVKVDLESGWAEVRTSHKVPDQAFELALEDTAYEVIRIER